MLKYQVSRCNEIGFKLLLFLVLTLVTWQALSPSPIEQSQLINDKIGHTLVFFILSAVADHAFPTTNFSLRKVSMLMLYGIAIECFQHYVPGREFSLLDMLADGFGIFCFWIVSRYIFMREPTPEKPE